MSCPGLVFLMAASSKRDAVDPALRRPGRLDKEIDIGVPDAKQREQVMIHNDV